MEGIEKYIIEEYKSKKDTYIRLGQSMNSLVDTLLHTSGIKAYTVQHRVKDEGSLKDKIQLKNKYKTISDITDILGLRIITYYSSDTDLVEDIIKNEFAVDSENTIDKRKKDDPDRFGYMSLHYVVSLDEKRSNLKENIKFKGIKFEIQIRTILQHTWAEIEHDLGYKSKSSVPLHIRRKFSSLSGALELIDGAFIEIRKSLDAYDEETKNQITAIESTSKDTQKRKNNKANHEVSDINAILIKNFIISSPMMQDLYDAYINQEKSKGVTERVIYPLDAKSDLDVNYENLALILKKLNAKDIGDILEITSEISEDPYIITTIVNNKPDYMPAGVLSKYFLFLFCIYIYIHKKELHDSFKETGSINLISQLGAAYSQIKK